MGGAVCWEWDAHCVSFPLCPGYPNVLWHNAILATEDSMGVVLLRDLCLSGPISASSIGLSPFFATYSLDTELR